MWSNFIPLLKLWLPVLQFLNKRSEFWNYISSAILWIFSRSTLGPCPFSSTRQIKLGFNESSQAYIRQSGGDFKFYQHSIQLKITDFISSAVFNWHLPKPYLICKVDHSLLITSPIFLTDIPQRKNISESVAGFMRVPTTPGVTKNQRLNYSSTVRLTES